MTSLKIEIAQLNFLVGAVPANCQRIIDCMQNSKADLIVFPEMCLTGYPIEDLIFRNKLHKQIDAAIGNIVSASETGAAVLIGAPCKTKGSYYNQALFIADGKLSASYNKQILPNYAVFDEKRYFQADNKTCIVNYKNIRFGLLICEDIWHKEPTANIKAEGADIILCINASPFHRYKNLVRHETIKKRIAESNLPIIYCNLVGGQDELIFDGGSAVYDNRGNLSGQAKFFAEDRFIFQLEKNEQIMFNHIKLNDTLEFNASIYKALVLGVKDYIEKNNFYGALIGLSGGIDSALTLAITVDAIGAENVLAVLMPSRYTADISNKDAIAEAEALGVDYKIIPIEPAFKTYLDSLKDIGEPLKPITQENLQARARCAILMAISNNTGSILISTSNKSELSVGYATLYGDMSGGFAAIKDVPKTLVYELARYRNSISAVIPKRVITREPSAELAPDQKDQDSLPPYNILDLILYNYIEKDKSIDEIHEQTNIAKDTIKKVAKLVNRNEYKRRQAPIGIRITERGFGKDRRYPITSGY